MLVYWCPHLGNALGMIGVSGGITATIGLLNPSYENLVQMGYCLLGGALLLLIEYDDSYNEMPSY